MMASSDYQDWMTGTTIMAVEFDGGVVIGADSRTTIGADFANRVIVKLAPAQGSAAATQAIADRAKYHLNFLSIEMGGPPLVKTVANVFREIYYTNRDDLTAGIICAGWDKSEGGQVFSIPLGGMCVRQPFAIEGSGSTYIYGHCDATFKRNMTKEECLSFVSNAVALAMSYDSSPGGIIHLTVIDETGIEKRVIQGYHPTSEEMVEITNEEGNYVKCPGEVIFDTGNLLGTAISAKPVKHTVDQANKRCYTEEARDGFAWTISRLKIKIELKLDVRKFSLVAFSKGIELLMRMDLIQQLSKGFILEKYTLGLLLLHNMSSS